MRTVYGAVPGGKIRIMEQITLLLALWMILSNCGDGRLCLRSHHHILVLLFSATLPGICKLDSVHIYKTSKTEALDLYQKR